MDEGDDTVNEDDGMDAVAVAVAPNTSCNDTNDCASRDASNNRRTQLLNGESMK